MIFGKTIWQRHANPWSVWTRFAAIPLLIAAVWSRVWLGWWSLALIALVILWLVLNPFVFRPVLTPRRWAEKGIYGERLWLQEKSRLPATCGAIQRWLILLGLGGMALIAYGLAMLQVWPTAFGATVLVIAQLWRIDRFSVFYDDWQREVREPN
jgi:hypothetical protein